MHINYILCQQCSGILIGLEIILSRNVLIWASCLAGQNRLGNFSRGHNKEHFCEIILNLDQMSFYLLMLITIRKSQA